MNFDAATELVTADHMREQFGCGPDVGRHVEIARPFVDAGYGHLALINAGPDMDGFFDFFTKELRPATGNDARSCFQIWALGIA